MRQKIQPPEPREQAAETLPFHPLAAKYGGNLSKKELAALAKDIADNGQRFPIIMHKGMIIDGTQRYRACLSLQKEPITVVYDVEKYGDSDSDIEEFIISANVHRRHYSARRKREIIELLVKRNPTKSDRAIAKESNSDNKTVASVRAEMERREEIPHVEKRTDTKGRNQSASKPSKGKLPEPPPIAVGTATPERDAPAPISNGAWWDQDPGKIAAQMVEHMPRKQVLSVLVLASDMLKVKQHEQRSTSPNSNPTP